MHYPPSCLSASVRRLQRAAVDVAADGQHTGSRFESTVHVVATPRQAQRVAGNGALPRGHRVLPLTRSTRSRRKGLAGCLASSSWAHSPRWLARSRPSILTCSSDRSRAEAALGPRAQPCQVWGELRAWVWPGRCWSRSAARMLRWFQAFVAGDVRSAQSSTRAAEMDKVRVCGGYVYLHTGEVGRY